MLDKYAEQEKEKVELVCEKCDGDIYEGEMHVLNKDGILFCMDCVSSMSKEKMEER